MQSLVFEAIGTRWQVDLMTEISPVAAAKLQEHILQRIDVFDKAYSRFRSDSLVTAMSKEAGQYNLPDDAEPLLKIYETLYRLTNGAFTPLIGQVISDAGYDAAYSLTVRELHHPPSWDEALTYHHPKLTLHQPALLDFGAAGKGYLIDIVAEVIQKEGVNSLCVDAGGDIFYRHAGEQKLRVGLEHPQKLGEVIGVAEVYNQSICGSAGNRRAWHQFHHIINPHSLSSPRHILATWVVAKNTLIADALATSLFFVSAKTLVTVFDFEWVVMYADGTVEKSSRFPGTVFIS